MSEVTFEDARAAKARLEPVLQPTPLQYSEQLSKRYGAHIYLKREDLQPVRSYKIRGAYNAITSLTPMQCQNGVVCASAGNHAQGVAWTATHLKIHATIFMPSAAPLQKVNRVRYFGGDNVQIVLAGNMYDDAAVAAHEFAKKHKAYFVHPFNDPATIAGQATVTLEIFEQLDTAPDMLVVPIGGGGLLAGAVVATKAQASNCQLVGVEPQGAASMAAARQHGKPVTLPMLDTFVDGCAVRTVGDLSANIVTNSTANLLAVESGLICKEMIDLYQNDGIVTEPAGALSVAALDQLRDAIKDKTVVCVISGGNNDISRYPEIIERSLIHQGLKHYFLVEFSQRPGQLRRFLEEALGPTDDIVRFEYTKKNNKESGPALVGLELAQKSDLGPLLKRIQQVGIKFQKITDDPLLLDFLV
jgi:threonine dehydratase